MMRPRYVIAVPDLRVSAAWYRDVLGFEIHEIGDAGWRFYRNGDCLIMAGECRDAIPPARLGDHSWFAYIEVPELDEYYEAVVARGGEILTPPEDQPWGMREFSVRTADGHRIRFGSPKSDAPRAD